MFHGSFSFNRQNTPRIKFMKLQFNLQSSYCGHTTICFILNELVTKWDSLNERTYEFE